MEPLHPLFVHLPLALALLMPLIAGGLLLAWHREWLPQRAFALAILLQVILVGSGIAARQTGERDEERVEAVVRHDPIEAHEEAADVFLYAAIGALVLLLAGGLRRFGKPLALAGTLGTLAVAGLGIRVGHLGGKIVYQEGGAAAWTDRQWQRPPEGREDDHD